MRATESPYGFDRRVAIEAIGTAMLLAVVVGSGIMAERLSPGNAGLALLAQSVATGAGLVALILALGPISGAHFNPAVTVVAAIRRALPWREVPGYLLAQFGGAFVGTVVAHAMFGEPMLSLSAHVRSGAGQIVGESVATFGLLFVILGTSRRRPDAAAFAVGAYITSAYWFTSSTSFANPAVTLARAATNTLSGIRFADVPLFVTAQLAGAVLAVLAFGWVARPEPSVQTVVAPTDEHVVTRRPALD